MHASLCVFADNKLGRHPSQWEGEGILTRVKERKVGLQMGFGGSHEKRGYNFVFALKWFFFFAHR